MQTNREYVFIVRTMTDIRDIEKCMKECLNMHTTKLISNLNLLIGGVLLMKRMA